MNKIGEPGGKGAVGRLADFPGEGVDPRTGCDKCPSAQITCPHLTKIRKDTFHFYCSPGMKMSYFEPC